MTSIRSTRGVRKEAGECCMTRWAYGVEPEASAPPPLHVRCAGCGARVCCCCLESSADVFETVASRNSLRRLRVLPHEFWLAWRGRAWRPGKPPTAALRRQQPDRAGCCGVWVRDCGLCLEQLLNSQHSQARPGYGGQ